MQTSIRHESGSQRGRFGIPAPSIGAKAPWTTLLKCTMFAVLALPAPLECAERAISGGFGSLSDNSVGIVPISASDVAKNLRLTGDYSDIDGSLASIDYTLSNGFRIGAREASDFHRYIGGELSYSYQHGQLTISRSRNQDLIQSAASAFAADPGLAPAPAPAPTSSSQAHLVTSNASVFPAEDPDIAIRYGNDINRLLDSWTRDVSEIGWTSADSFSIGVRSHHVYYNVVGHVRPTGKKLRPFLTAGAGLSGYWMGLSDIKTIRDDLPSYASLVPFSVSVGYNYGAGLKYNWSTKHGVRFDVRNHVAAREILNPIRIMLKKEFDPDLPFPVPVFNMGGNIEFSVSFTFL